MTEQNLFGKRPLGRPKIRWEVLIKKYVELLGGGLSRKKSYGYRIIKGFGVK